jgi:hypothetical protein
MRRNSRALFASVSWKFENSQNVPAAPRLLMNFKTEARGEFNFQQRGAFQALLANT